MSIDLNVQGWQGEETWAGRQVLKVGLTGSHAEKF